VEEVLSWGASPFEADEWGATPLHLATATAHENSVMVADLLATAAEALGSYLPLDVPDARGCTPLHYSASAGDTAFVTWLLERGASPFLTDREGYTAEVYAKQAGSVACATMLQQAAAAALAARVESAAQETLASAGDDVQRLIDPDSGCAYYLNMRTGESR
jgi:ankyrin repeat protein